MSGVPPRVAHVHAGVVSAVETHDLGAGLHVMTELRASAGGRCLRRGQGQASCENKRLMILGSDVVMAGLLDRCWMDVCS